MHAEAVVFDFVQPLVAVRRFRYELRQLRPYPLREARSAPLRFAPCREGADAGLVRHLGERLDQARVVVPDVADARANRPANHFVGQGRAPAAPSIPRRPPVLRRARPAMFRA